MHVAFVSIPYPDGRLADPADPEMFVEPLLVFVLDPVHLFVWLLSFIRQPKYYFKAVQNTSGCGPMYRIGSQISKQLKFIAAVHWRCQQFLRPERPREKGQTCTKIYTSVIEKYKTDRASKHAAVLQPAPAAPVCPEAQARAQPTT